MPNKKQHYCTVFMQHIDIILASWDSDKKTSIDNAIDLANNGVNAISSAVDTATFVLGVAGIATAPTIVGLPVTAAAIGAVQGAYATYKFAKGLLTEKQEDPFSPEQNNAKFKRLSFNMLCREVADIASSVRYHYLIEKIASERGVAQLARYAAERTLKNVLSGTVFPTAEAIVNDWLESKNSSSKQFETEIGEKLNIKKAYALSPRAAFFDTETKTYSLVAPPNEYQRQQTKYGYVVLPEQSLFNNYTERRKAQSCNITEQDKQDLVTYVKVTRELIQEYLDTAKTTTHPKESLNDFLSRHFGCTVIAQCHDDTLKDLDLRYGNFCDVNFRRADLQGCQLESSHWNNACLDEACFGHAEHPISLKATSFQGVWAEKSLWYNIDFSDATFAQSQMSGAYLEKCIWGSMTTTGSVWELAELCDMQPPQEDVIQQLQTEYNERLQQNVDRLDKAVQDLDVQLEKQRENNEKLQQDVDTLNKITKEQHDLLNVHPLQQCILQEYQTIWQETKGEEPVYELSPLTPFHHQNEPLLLPWNDAVEHFLSQQNPQKFNLISGIAHSGKSSLVHDIQDYLSNNISRNGWFPLIIRFADIPASFYDNGLTAGCFLGNYLSDRYGYAPEEIAILRQKKWLIILDDVDECPPDLKERFLSGEEFALWPHTRVIATARHPDLFVSNANHWEHYQLDPSTEIHPSPITSISEELNESLYRLGLLFSVTRCIELSNKKEVSSFLANLSNYPFLALTHRSGKRYLMISRDARAYLAAQYLWAHRNDSQTISLWSVCNFLTSPECCTAFTALWQQSESPETEAEAIFTYWKNNRHTNKDPHQSACRHLLFWLKYVNFPCETRLKEIQKREQQAAERLNERFSDIKNIYIRPKRATRLHPNSSENDGMGLSPASIILDQKSSLSAPTMYLSLNDAEQAMVERLLSQLQQAVQEADHNTLATIRAFVPKKTETQLKATAEIQKWTQEKRCLSEQGLYLKALLSHIDSEEKELNSNCFIITYPAACDFYSRAIERIEEEYVLKYEQKGLVDNVAFKNTLKQTLARIGDLSADIRALQYPATIPEGDDVSVHSLALSRDGRYSTTTINTFEAQQPIDPNQRIILIENCLKQLKNDKEVLTNEEKKLKLMHENINPAQYFIQEATVQALQARYHILIAYALGSQASLPEFSGRINHSPSELNTLNTRLNALKKENPVLLKPHTPHGVDQFGEAEEPSSDSNASALMRESSLVSNRTTATSSLDVANQQKSTLVFPHHKGERIVSNDSELTTENSPFSNRTSEASQLGTAHERWAPTIIPYEMLARIALVNKRFWKERENSYRHDFYAQQRKRPAYLLENMADAEKLVTKKNSYLFVKNPTPTLWYQKNKTSRVPLILDLTVFNRIKDLPGIAPNLPLEQQKGLIHDDVLFQFRELIIANEGHTPQKCLDAEGQWVEITDVLLQERWKTYENELKKAINALDAKACVLLKKALYQNETVAKESMLELKNILEQERELLSQKQKNLDEKYSKQLDCLANAVIVGAQERFNHLLKVFDGVQSAYSLLKDREKIKMEQAIGNGDLRSAIEWLHGQFSGLQSIIFKEGLIEAVKAVTEGCMDNYLRQYPVADRHWRLATTEQQKALLDAFLNGNRDPLIEHFSTILPYLPTPTKDTLERYLRLGLSPDACDKLNRKTLLFMTLEIMSTINDAEKWETLTKVLYHLLDSGAALSTSCANNGHNETPLSYAIETLAKNPMDSRWNGIIAFLLNYLQRFEDNPEGEKLLKNCSSTLKQHLNDYKVKKFPSDETFLTERGKERQRSLEIYEKYAKILPLNASTVDTICEEILAIARKAPRGFMGRSELHDNVIQIIEAYQKELNTNVYSETELIVRDDRSSLVASSQTMRQLNRELRKRDDVIEKDAKSHIEKDQEIKDLKEKVAERENTITAHESMITEKNSTIADLQQELIKMQAIIQALKEESDQSYTHGSSYTYGGKK